MASACPATGWANGGLQGAGEGGKGLYELNLFWARMAKSKSGSSCWSSLSRISPVSPAGHPARVYLQQRYSAVPLDDLLLPANKQNGPRCVLWFHPSPFPNPPVRHERARSHNLPRGWITTAATCIDEKMKTTGSGLRVTGPEPRLK